MSEKILFIGGGIEGIEGIKWAKKEGFETLVADMNPEAPGARIADGFLEASAYHPTQVLQAVGAYPDRKDIVSVITIGHDAPHTVSSVCQHLGLPGISKETARLSTDKLAMKECLQEKGVPIPPFRKIQSIGDLQDVICEWGYPLVLKPVDNRGARGVLKLTMGIDPKWAFDYSLDHSASRTLIAEQWIEGPQLSTESILWEDRAILCGICDREYASTEDLLPYVIEGGSVTPSSLSKKEVSAVASAVHDAGRALGLSRGTLKGDVVMSETGPRIIEVAPRLSGGYFCTHTIPLAFGVNLIEHAMHISMGIEPDWTKIKPRPRQFVVSTCLFVPEGVVEKIEFTDDSHAQKWVALLQMNIQEGDRVSTCTSHAARGGLIITRGSSRREGIVRGEKTLGSIHVTVNGVQ